MKKYDHIIKAYIKKNKRQNIYTVIGLILACTLFTTVTCVLSLEKSINKREMYRSSGYYDALFRGVNKESDFTLENNIYADKVGKISEQDNVSVNGTDKSLKLYSINDTGIKYIFRNQIEIIEGTLPLEKNEIILTENVMKELNKKINESIEIKNKEYIITGIYEAKSGSYTSTILKVSDPKERYIGEGITTNELKGDNGNYIAIKFKEDVSKEKINEILNKNTVEFIRNNHEYNFKIEEVLGSILVGIINIFSTLILIYGAINIGMREKEKYFSLLRCIGLTKNKLMYLLLKEKIILGIVSIPIGAFLGYCIVSFNKNLIVQLLNYGELNEGIIQGLKLNPVIIFQVIVIGLIILGISSILPAIKISKRPPIEGLKEIRKVKRKKNKKNNRLRKINYNAYLAYKNVKRNGKRFNTVIMILSTIGIIFSLVTGYYYFTKQYNHMKKSEFGGNIVGFVSNSNISKLEQLEEHILKLNKNQPLVSIGSFSNIKLSNNYLKVNNKNFEILGYNDAAFNKIKNKIIGEKSLEDFKRNGVIIVRNEKEGLSDNKLEDKNIVLESREDKNEKLMDANLMGEIDISDLNLDKNSLNNSLIIVPLKMYNEILEITKKQNKENIFSEINFNIDSLNKEQIKEIDKKANDVELSFINKKEINEQGSKYINSFISSVYILLGLIVLNMVVNMINNNYVNMKLRRSEFGSIISVGVSKKRLKKILVLEGIITWVIAGAISIGVSSISLTVMYLIFYIQGIVVSKGILFLIIILGVIILLPINLIAILLPITSLKVDSVMELMRED